MFIDLKIKSIYVEWWPVSKANEQIVWHKICRGNYLTLIYGEKHHTQMYMTQPGFESAHAVKSILSAISIVNYCVALLVLMNPTPCEKPMECE
jgi:hypothetical protein